MICLKMDVFTSLLLFSTIEVDEFTAKIFEIYEKTRNEGLSQVSSHDINLCKIH